MNLMCLFSERRMCHTFVNYQSTKRYNLLIGQQSILLDQNQTLQQNRHTRTTKMLKTNKFTNQHITASITKIIARVQQKPLFSSTLSVPPASALATLRVRSSVFWSRSKKVENGARRSEKRLRFLHPEREQRLGEASDMVQR